MKPFIQFLVLFFFSIFPFECWSQTQKGLDIDGEAAGDFSGYFISIPDAVTIGIGAYGNDGNGAESGHLRVYSWNGNMWTQKGSDIDGESAGDLSGTSMSMPDANTVAIGAPHNSGYGTDAGHVRVFSWNGNAWVQKGVDIDGEMPWDQSGYSVSMPDANTLAIGAPLNGGYLNRAGHVRIFVWNGTSWVQKGTDIDGEAIYDESGRSVYMPNANTIAIGAYHNSGNGNHSGHVRVYNWNGIQWTQKGADIDGEAAGDNSGLAISMPDTNTIAIGAPNNGDNGFSSGHVRVYKWNNNSWVQKGSDIDGEASGDKSGSSVDMPDSNTLIVGAPRNSGSGNSAGHIRVFAWNGTSWIQNGGDIDGESTFDNFGQSVSAPDIYTLGGGAPFNSGNGNNSGHARVFCIPSIHFLNPVVCDSYTSPTGNHTWTASGHYQDTLTNHRGCDSIIHINLTIQNADSISRVVCDSFTSPSGRYTWSQSGFYKDTLFRSVGCDSLLTIDLTVNPTSFSTLTPVVCDSYNSPSGNYTWTTTGTYSDTLTNVYGCDSIFNVNLTVNNSYNTYISPEVCESYTSPSGNYTWTSSGTYSDTLSSMHGCDSILHINLTINHHSEDSATVTACDSYTWLANGQTYLGSGVFSDTIPNIKGCDSAVTLLLTIDSATSSTQTISSCFSFTSPSGQFIWNTSGVYYDTIPNTQGCDSVITFNLTIDTVAFDSVYVPDSLAVGKGLKLPFDGFVDQNGVLTVFSAQTTRQFGVEGEVAVYQIQTEKGCTDTAFVKEMLVYTPQEEEVESTPCFVKVSPNPGDKTCLISANQTLQDLGIYDSRGRLIYGTDQPVNTPKIMHTSQWPVGVYFIQARCKDNDIKRLKWIKK